MDIFVFYCKVIENMLKTTELTVSSSAVTQALSTLANAYNRSSMINKSNAVDYSDILPRLAYLFKYATCHTLLVETTLQRFSMLSDSLWSDLTDRTIKICALGSGPGCDVVGVLRVLTLDLSRVQVTLVDVYQEWDQTFGKIIQAVGEGHLPLVPSNSEIVKNWFYIRADLTEPLDETTRSAISDADFITMVKFLSAVPVNDNYISEMLQEILSCVKPGAFVLLIDGTGAAACQFALIKAKDYGMNEVFSQSGRYDLNTTLNDAHYMVNYYPLCKKYKDVPLQHSHCTSVIWRRSA